MTPGAKVAHGSVAGATPAASPPVYYAWLDAVRFLSALMVVCYHARPEHWPAWSTLPAAERTPGAAAFFFSIGMGTEAVAIFFVLSGFLIGGKVIRESRQGTFDAARFAVDRGVRLYVPLIPALALTVLCDKWLWPQEAGWRWAETLGNLFNLQGILVEPHRSNAVLWSLSCEFWLYVAAGSVLPLIFRGPAGRRARGGGIWIVGIVALAFLAGLFGLIRT
ncbi:MAG: acyltransferase family protein, partial [Verrucomicrobiota bacterium]